MNRSCIDKVNIGIVGCGWITEFAHIPALEKIECVNIKALFDVDDERVHSLGSKRSIKGQFTDFEEFITCGLDGIIIATPNFTHVSYTIAALKRGVAVLCEKPVAFRIDEIEEIIKASNEGNAIYVPGFVNRWRKDIQLIYNELKSGKLGDLEKIDAGWIRKNGVPRPGTWFTNREYAGGGVLTDLGSHVIDICMMLAGDLTPESFELNTSLCNSEKMKNAGAAGWFTRDDNQQFDIDVEDNAVAHVKFENNVELHVKLSWLASVQADCTYFKIKGSKGSIELKTLFGFSNERLWKEDTLVREIEGKTSTEYLDRDTNNSKCAFEEMHQYFVRVIKEKKADVVNYNDAKRTVGIIEKLYQCEQVKEHILMEEEQI